MSLPHWETRTGPAQWNQHFSGNGKCYDIAHELEFRTWQRYGKVLPSSLPFWNNFAGITFRVNYPSGTACWEAENPEPGQCPAPELVPCLCCSPFRNSLALGQNSIQTPNISLCLNKSLEIISQSKYLGITWIIPSLRALHFTCSGTSFKYFRKMF